jgi:hypothetical protein
MRNARSGSATGRPEFLPALDRAFRLWLVRRMKFGLRRMFLLVVAVMAPCAAMAAPPQPEVTLPFQLITLKGDTYENCYILKRTPGGLTVLHDKGVAKLSFAVLGDEWRTKYRYDEAKAAEFVKEEAERREQLLARERERLAAEQAAAATAAAAALADSQAQLAASQRASAQLASQLSSYAQSYGSEYHRSSRYSSRGRYRYPYSSYYGYGSVYYYPVYYYRSPVCRTRSRTSVSSVGSSSRVSSAPRASSPVMRVGR